VVTPLIFGPKINCLVGFMLWLYSFAAEEGWGSRPAFHHSWAVCFQPCFI